MFTKDLAIFGTCATTIRNRPDGDHEELILTAFVIPLSLSLLLPHPLLPSHLSFALFLFLSPTLSLICITRTTRLWIRTPTHTRLAVARQKPYISRGIRRREILKREKRPRIAGLDSKKRDTKEEDVRAYSYQCPVKFAIIAPFSACSFTCRKEQFENFYYFST